jgi:hypothetical protein
MSRTFDISYPPPDWQPGNDVRSGTRRVGSGFDRECSADSGGSCAHENRAGARRRLGDSTTVIGDFNDECETLDRDRDIDGGGTRVSLAVSQRLLGDGERSRRTLRAHAAQILNGDVNRESCENSESLLHRCQYLLQLKQELPHVNFFEQQVANLLAHPRIGEVKVSKRMCERRFGTLRQFHCPEHFGAHHRENLADVVVQKHRELRSFATTNVADLARQIAQAGR